VTESSRRRALRPLVIIAIATALACAAALAALVTLAGGSGSSAETPAAQGAKATTGTGPFAGGLIQEPKAAPELALTDQDGEVRDISADRGRVVLVTFLYTRCPDVCPLTTELLRRSLDRLGDRAKAVRILAVSVDPANDTPAAVRRFIARHHMTGRMDYLVGTPEQLRPIWSRWGVAAVTDPTDADFVSHSALVYGIGASGRLLTVYPWNLRPADLAHDVPILARS
jgi:protein SCO1/2